MAAKPDFDTYFDDETLIKAHYHPSLERKLSSTQRQTMLSPQKIPERESGLCQEVTPETEKYLRRDEYVYSKDPMPDHETPSPPSTVKFDESWPSTEKHSVNSGKGQSKTECEISSCHDESVLKPSDTSGSVLSRYIQRFRNDPPRSRKDRKIPSLKQFWWGPHSVNVGAENHSDQSLLANDNSSSDRDFSLSSAMTPTSTGTASSKQKGKRITFDVTTPKTRALIDKTNSMISESGSLDEHGPVSSDGVGSTSSSSCGPYHSTPEEPSVRPVLHREFHTTGSDRPSILKQKFPNTEESTRSQPLCEQTTGDDDILARWRQKRALELAKEKVINAEMSAKWSSWENNRARKKMTVHVVNPDMKSSSIHHQQYQDVPQSNYRPARQSCQDTYSEAVPKTVQTDPETIQATTQTPAAPANAATETVVTSGTQVGCENHVQLPTSPAKCHTCHPSGSVTCSCCGQTTPSRSMPVMQPPHPPISQQTCSCTGDVPTRCGGPGCSMILPTVHPNSQTCAPVLPGHQCHMTNSCTDSRLEAVKCQCAALVNAMCDNAQEAARHAALNNTCANHLRCHQHNHCDAHNCSRPCSTASSPSKTLSKQNRSPSHRQHARSVKTIQISQHSPSKAKVRLHFDPQSRRSAGRLSRDTGSPSSIPSPSRKSRQSSFGKSPIRKSQNQNEALAHAISEVMSEHLFVKPKKSSRVAPAISKSVPSQSKSFQQAQRHLPTKPGSKSKTLSSAPLPAGSEESDDEFEGDEILKVLRVKRKSLLDRIRSLDEKIALASSSCSEQS